MNPTPTTEFDTQASAIRFVVVEHTSLDPMDVAISTRTTDDRLEADIPTNASFSRDKLRTLTTKHRVTVDGTVFTIVLETLDIKNNWFIFNIN